jgi:hypothetical protein
VHCVIRFITLSNICLVFSNCSNNARCTRCELNGTRVNNLLQQVIREARKNRYHSNRVPQIVLYKEVTENVDKSKPIERE